MKLAIFRLLSYLRNTASRLLNWKYSEILSRTKKPVSARRTRPSGNLDGAVALGLASQAVNLKSRGDLDGAMAPLKEAERLGRELSDKAVLSVTLGTQAMILKSRGDLDGAMARHQEAERLHRELGNKFALARTLGEQANILHARGDIDGAMARHKESERLCREIDDTQGVVISLANQAKLLSNTPGRRREARQLADEALAIATRHGYQQLVPRLQRIRDSIPPEAA